MSTLITRAVTGLAGTAVTGMLLMGQPWADDEPVTRRDVVEANQEAEENEDDPTDDLTRDTNSRNSNPSRPARVTRGTGVTRDRDVSVDAAPTSGVTNGTVSGGAGTVDVSPTSGITRGTVSGGAGTDEDRIGSGGGAVSRDVSRDITRDISRGSGGNSGDSRSRG